MLLGLTIPIDSNNLSCCLKSHCCSLSWHHYLCIQSGIFVFHWHFREKELWLFLDLASYGLFGGFSSDWINFLFLLLLPSSFIPFSLAEPKTINIDKKLENDCVVLGLPPGSNALWEEQRQGELALRFYGTSPKLLQNPGEQAGLLTGIRAYIQT